MDETPDAAGPARSFTVDVANRVLRSALLYIGASGGWSEPPRPDPHAVTVVDRVPDVPPAPSSPPAPRARRILVAEPSPYASARAMSALASGTVTAVVSAHDPDELLVALESVERGQVTIPVCMVDLAADMPKVSSRQVEVLGAIIAGQSNREIARALYLSDASVKREISGLFRALAAPNRIALAQRGAALGVTARRLGP